MKLHTSVMLVDHEIGALAIMEIMLERAGYDVIKARSADECLASLNAHTPDILIADLTLAGKSSVQLIRKVRGHKAFIDLPILVLSSQLDSDAVIQAIEAGANDYLIKPILAHDLTEKVRIVLEKSATDSFPAGCALVLHTDYPNVDHLVKLCASVSARISAPVVALPSRSDRLGKNRNLIEALRASRSLTLCVTAHNLSLPYMRSAYEFYAGHEKPLTAILFEDVELPDAFNTSHAFLPTELEAYCEWLAGVHRTQRHYY